MTPCDYQDCLGDGTFTVRDHNYYWQHAKIVAGWDERSGINPTAIRFINTISSQKSQVKQQSLTSRGDGNNPPVAALRGVGWGE